MNSTIIIILSALLVTSAALNVFTLWYSIRITRTVMFFSENLADLDALLADFASHLASIYHLETFYGDETLHSLLRHSQELVQQLERFDEIIHLSEDPEEEHMDEENEQQRDTPGEIAEEKNNPTETRFEI
jgi:hypothetical protein